MSAESVRIVLKCHRGHLFNVGPEGPPMGIKFCDTCGGIMLPTRVITRIKSTRRPRRGAID